MYGSSRVASQILASSSYLRGNCVGGTPILDRAHHLGLCTALPLAPNEVTDIFAIVGVVPTLDLRLDPVILLVRQRYGLADSSHEEPPNLHQ